MKFKKSFFLSFLLSIAVLGMSVFAAEAGNSTVAATIQSRTWVDLSRSSMSWTTSVDPGSTPSCDTANDCIDTGRGHNVYALEVENIGSENVSKIWVNTTMPSSNPFASGDNSNYDPGNFIAVSITSGGGSDYYFVNRVEFAMPRAPVYLKRGSIPNDRTGRFRNASKEWFWGLNKSSGCNETGTQLYIGDSAHDPNGAMGDIDLTDNTPWTLTTSSTDNTYGWANITIGGEEYNVVVPSDCSRVIFYKWNMDLPGASETGTNAAYIFDNETEGHDFAPGNYTPIYVELRVPYGVAVGSLTQGMLRVMTN